MAISNILMLGWIQDSSIRYSGAWERQMAMGDMSWMLYNNECSNCNEYAFKRGDWTKCKDQGSFLVIKQLGLEEEIRENSENVKAMHGLYGVENNAISALWLRIWDTKCSYGGCLLCLGASVSNASSHISVQTFIFG